MDLNQARSRVLAEDVLAAIDLPPFDSSAMDGYGLNSTRLAGAPPYETTLVGQSLAGHPFADRLGPRQCIRITTGAAVPAAVDAVVPQEDCDVDGERVTIRVEVRQGANVRRRGNDIAAGASLLTAGHQLGPFDIAWLAATGIDSVLVRTRPRVAYFSTGDELRDAPAALTPGTIYDSNRRVLSELLKPLPVQTSNLGILPDEPAAIEAALARAADEHELLLTTGGVSVGTADYLKDVVMTLGTLTLWRLNLKPGKPLAFGEIGGCPFLGLPGNPVSTIVTFLLVARPAILTLAGASDRAPSTPCRATLTSPLNHSPGREEYQRGTLTFRDNLLEVAVTGDQSSNRLATFSNADCLIRVPKSCGDLSVGTEVDVLPFKGLLD